MTASTSLADFPLRIIFFQGQPVHLSPSHYIMSYSTKKASTDRSLHFSINMLRSPNGFLPHSKRTPLTFVLLSRDSLQPDPQMTAHYWWVSCAHFYVGEWGEDLIYVQAKLGCKYPLSINTLANWTPPAIFWAPREIDVPPQSMVQLRGATVVPVYILVASVVLHWSKPHLLPTQEHRCQASSRVGGRVYRRHSSQVNASQG